MYEQSLDVFIECSKQFISESNVGIVFEIGTRDCKETVVFAKFLENAVIYAFECNPATIPDCYEAIKDLDRVYLIEKAVSDKEGKVKFYQIDQERTQTTWSDGNPGASSLLKTSGKYSIENYVQREIEVESTTLESFMRDKGIEVIDLLWMDTQGAELSVLKGLGSRIKDVKLIHTEVEFFEIYAKQPLFQDIYQFLKKQGFLLLKFTSMGEYAGDAIFVNKRVIKGYLKSIKLQVLDSLLRLRQKYRFHEHMNISAILVRLMKTVLSRLGWPNDRRSLYFFWLKRAKPFFGSISQVRSSLPIDVVIPVVKKDLITLSQVIDAAKRYVAHPIMNIIIIAPDDTNIKDLCTEKQCKFIDENTVLPICRRDIEYVVNGVDRSGWIFQQFLKLGSDSVCTQANYLVIDADTVLLRSHSFKHGKKVIFNCSDEYHHPYFETFRKLFGYETNFPLSFISHIMLFEKDKLIEFRKEIEAKNGKDWYWAIISKLDITQTSSFSEQDSYANFVWKKHKNSIILEYWFNFGLARSNLADLDTLSSKFSHLYKSVSFHSYF